MRFVLETTENYGASLHPSAISPDWVLEKEMFPRQDGLGAEMKPATDKIYEVEKSVGQ